MSANHLQLRGKVLATDARGDAVGWIAAPWAVDARGQAVPTHFTVAGNLITQVVDFSARTAFPVVADPSWWQYAIAYAGGAAVAAAVDAIPAVGPTVGAIAGGCATNAILAAFDGRSLLGVFKACLIGAVTGAIFGMIYSVGSKAIALFWAKNA